MEDAIKAWLNAKSRNQIVQLKLQKKLQQLVQARGKTSGILANLHFCRLFKLQVSYSTGSTAAAA